MSNDDCGAAVAVGFLLGTIGILSIVFRPTFGPDSDEERKIRQAWGMTKRETLPLVTGILFLITGVFFILTALVFKFANTN